MEGWDPSLRTFVGFAGGELGVPARLDGRDARRSTTDVRRICWWRARRPRPTGRARRPSLHSRRSSDLLVESQASPPGWTGETPVALQCGWSRGVLRGYLRTTRKGKLR